jgi:hypothetical protein
MSATSQSRGKWHVGSNVYICFGKNHKLQIGVCGGERLGWECFCVCVTVELVSSVYITVQVYINQSPFKNIVSKMTCPVFLSHFLW